MGRPKEVTDQQILVVARRVLLARGASVAASEIAQELGVSHTTLFNRFGSKEGLMLAALGAPESIPWVAALDAGPDEGPDARSLRDQLVEHAQAMSSYFQALQAGYAVLQAAGIDPRKAYATKRGASGPEKAYVALVGWLGRAHAAGELGPQVSAADLGTIASTILAALQGWAFTTRVCGGSTSSGACDLYVERFVDLLFRGVGPRE